MTGLDAFVPDLYCTHRWISSVASIQRQWTWVLVKIDQSRLKSEMLVDQFRRRRSSWMWLAVHPHWYQLRSALRILDDLRSVFGREFTHHESQLEIGCHLERHPSNALYVSRGTGSAMIYFYKELDVVHDFSYSLKG
jgi:hypothetical protein